MSDTMTPEEFLAHYGVKGMKWGVRKARTGDLGTSAARLKRYASGESKKAGGLRRLVDTAEAVGQYSGRDLIKGRGLHEAAKIRGKAMEKERNRLANGKATRSDILRAYGSQAILTYINPVAGAVRLASTAYDSDKKLDNNRPAKSKK